MHLTHIHTLVLTFFTLVAACGSTQKRDHADLRPAEQVSVVYEETVKPQNDGTEDYELVISASGAWKLERPGKSRSGTLSEEGKRQFDAALDAALVQAVSPRAFCDALPNHEITVKAGGGQATWVDHCGDRPTESLAALRLLVHRLVELQ